MKTVHPAHRFVIGGVALSLFAGPACPVFAQQSIQNETGGVFMEESAPPSKPETKAPPVDLSNTGTQFNSKGRIVPLLQNDGAGSMPPGTTLEVSRTPGVMYAPTYYVNPFGQKVDAYGRLLPPGNYLPYTPYATSPGYGATFNSQSGPTEMNYQGGGTVFGGPGIGIGGGNGRFGGGVAIPGTTQFDYRGTVKPIFPQEQ